METDNSIIIRDVDYTETWTIIKSLSIGSYVHVYCYCILIFRVVL